MANLEFEDGRGTWRAWTFAAGEEREAFDRDPLNAAMRLVEVLASTAEEQDEKLAGLSKLSSREVLQLVEDAITAGDSQDASALAEVRRRAAIG